MSCSRQVVRLSATQVSPLTSTLTLTSFIWWLRLQLARGQNLRIRAFGDALFALLLASASEMNLMEEVPVRA